MATRPIAPDVFSDTPLCLIGGRHPASGRLVFPLPPPSAGYERVELPSRGALWSYTVQRFAPKSPPYRGPEPFEAFAVGYVELPGALIVESRLTGVDFDRMQVGMAMELTTIPCRTDPDGCVVLSYAFRPARGAAP